MKFTAILFLLFSNLVFADAGLVQGDSFTSKVFYGRVSSWCRANNGGPRFQLYNCGVRNLSPRSTSEFFTTSGVEGDRVFLTNLSSDRSKKKKLRFDSSTGRSVSSLNLWIDTLTQTPFLQYGENRIQYQIKNKRKLVEEGEFKVTVINEGETRCRDWNYNLPFNCDDYFYVCRMYFNQSNSCQ